MLGRRLKSHFNVGLVNEFDFAIEEAGVGEKGKEI